jgi:ABC-type multidrug transport system ATPase subunit
MTNAIEARGVGKVYGEGAGAVGLHELTLDVAAGRVVALLGHNGAGKTTLVRGLATLHRFDRGVARVAGHDVRTESRQVRERISLVGQGVAVDEQLTASQNLVLFGRLRGLTRVDARDRATALVDEFGLVGSENRPVAGFSGGMRRRLDVAASMIVRPDVLFVDEPTTGLDPAARRDLWGVLAGLVDSGTTVLLTTQYLEEADALADHIVLLAHGRVVAEGTSGDLKGMLGRSVLQFRFTTAADAAAARTALAAVDPSVHSPNGSTVVLGATDGNALFASVGVLAAQGITPSEASLRQPSLDEVFLSLTTDAPTTTYDDREETAQ